MSEQKNANIKSMRQPHSHHFATFHKKNEHRTLIVVILTLITMIVEIVAGILTGSMALLSDGWHMGTHAGALGIAYFAYVFSRKYAESQQFTFGTGKVGILAAYTSAIILAMTGIMIFYESFQRLINPVAISFNTALIVAVTGLGVNLLCAWILKSHDEHHHDHGHNQTDEQHHHKTDHNYRAAFLHVIADAMTSVFAIIALIIGKYYGLIQLDPIVGFLGAIMILWWAYGLIRQTGHILLDGNVNPQKLNEVRDAIQNDSDNQVLDLHIWHVSENDLAAVIAISTLTPKSPEYYRSLLEAFSELKHVTIEVYQK